MTNESGCYFFPETTPLTKTTKTLKQNGVLFSRFLSPLSKARTIITTITTPLSRQNSARSFSLSLSVSIVNEECFVHSRVHFLYLKRAKNSFTLKYAKFKKTKTMVRVLLPPPVLASLLATSATIWLVLFCLFVEKLSANALGNGGVKIGAFPVGSPCYANYQCVKNEAFCEKEDSEEDDESMYMYRSAEYKYRVEAEYGLHGYDDASFMDDLAMNVARFASAVAKVMDVDARTVEALEVRGDRKSVV